MPVRFVIGRSGSGKSAHCVGRIADACRAESLGSPILWIVPKQATFQAERQLACSAGLQGYCRARVQSFDQLAREVLAECGGVAIPEINPFGRQMILGHLLRKHEADLRYFGSVARQTGLIGRLDATLAELERSGKSAGDLKALLAELDQTPGDDAQTSSLRLKLHDLHLIAGAYDQYLGQERLDPHRRLGQVLSSISQCGSLRGCTVFVDGFFEFNVDERQTLSALAKTANEMWIALTADPDSPTLADPHHLPDEMDLFHQTLDAYRRLYFRFREDDIEIESPLLMRTVHRFQSPDLANIQSYWMQPPPADAQAGGLELVEAPHRRAEAEAAADCVRELVGQGMRYRDIAILCRDIGQYHELLDAAFREREIPYFADHRRGMSHHPLLEMLRCILVVARQDWPNEALMMLSKTGLVKGIDLDDADRLENYVICHRIHGTAWVAAEPWSFLGGSRDELTGEPKPDPNNTDIDALRRLLVDPLRRWLDGPLRTGQFPLRQYATALYETLRGYAVGETLERWMKEAEAAGSLERRDEHEQTWNELIALLDLMVDILGDEPLTAADFAEILESGLDQFDLALTPPTVDQVLIGQMDRTRLSDVRAVLALGLCEGSFPRRCGEDLILCDDERRELRHWRLEIDPDSRRQLLDENLLAYRAFTRPSNRLIVFRPEADDAGRPLPRSVYWDALTRLCPDAPVRSISPDADDLATLSTPRRLVTRMMRWAREPDESNSAMSALYQWLATYPKCDDAMDVMRVRAWRALKYHNDASLPDELAIQLFGLPLETSATRLESFAACPFQHFLRYGLSLQQRGDDQMSIGDQGWAYHQILGRFIGQMLKNNTDWQRMKPEQREKAVGRIAHAIGLTLKGQVLLDSARNQFVLNRIARTVEQVLSAQAAALSHGRFAPAYTQVRYGGEGALLPLTLKTPSGQTIHLQGGIDRIDLIDKDHSAVIYDYKLKGGTFSLDKAYYGLSLQLPAALLALKSGGASLTGQKVSPMGAFYVQLHRELESVKHPDDAVSPDDPAFHLRIKPRGIFDQRCADSLDGETEDGKSKVYQFSINKKDGRYSTKSDVVSGEQFDAFLDHISRTMAELSQQLLEGMIPIRPYLMEQTSACSRCDLQAVCRFEVEQNRYLPLEKIKREEVLNRVLPGMEEQ
ncbi:MAG: PD-(D/E)XK nuclease family protein [Phycisphaerales bacterium]|jgi:ATP-dependent helicase/nuclease subunit B|nr:PD-(D/E)XK nuclease family protein [Phycisphaerales bacterium]